LIGWSAGDAEHGMGGMSLTHLITLLQKQIDGDIEDFLKASFQTEEKVGS